ETQSPVPKRATLRALSWIPWFAVAGCMVAIVVIRSTAHSSDFAIANALTALLILVSWLMLTLGLSMSRLPRSWWRVALLAPICFLLLFLSAYKFQRFDGELSPQFSWRWGTADASTSMTLDARKIAPEMFAPRWSDFPQYLGKNRDASIPQVSLDPDWKTSPPRIAWKVGVGEAWSGFAVQGDVAVTMEQRGEQEWVSAYSVLDGDLLWNANINSKHSNMMGGVGPRSTPTISDNRVYATSAVSRLLCLELATGHELWTQDLLDLAGVTQAEFEQEVAWGRSASPLIVDDLIVIPLGGVGDEKHTLIAFDRLLGEERWRGGSDQISYASPALVELSGQWQILLLSEKHLAGYDIETGSQLWSTPWPGSSAGSASVSQPVVVDPSHILLSKGYGEGCQYLQVEHVDESWTIDVLWTNRTSLKTKFTNCVVRDGYAYGLSDGILECVRLEDGQKQWKKGRYRQGQLLLVGEYLLITAESGELVLVQADPQGMKELDKLAVIGDVTWNTAALSGDRLLMRNAEEAACVLLPLRTLATENE
ncbi:MAG: PQQ-binding-like beta-propeller repeat protein, partial [Planctomycetales bacterium]|nr:PQQ-binding-like beta-propeller repeat protein [Planctomycetales bacterium]